MPLLSQTRKLRSVSLEPNGSAIVITVKGSIFFQGLAEAPDSLAEHSRLAAIMEQAGAKGIRWDGLEEVVFTEIPPASIGPMLEQLKYRTDNNSTGGRSLVNELIQFSAEMNAGYRTADIRAGIETTISFHVTPGAKLFYAARPGQKEEQVSVASDGSVSFKIRLARGQDFIYARTELGAVKKFIRVDVYSGKTSEIQEVEYRRGVK